MLDSCVTLAVDKGCNALLDSVKESFKLKLGKHNGLITPEGASQTDYYEAIDVREREEA